MANAKRGEIDATLDGKTFTLCLTLGALAELESGFGASDLVALASRFEERRLSARDILRIIGCGLRGAGHDISDADVARMKVSEGLAGYVRIAANLLAATFGDAPAHDPPANPPTPQDA
ncbi:MAG: gene transfer agent family protein [Methylocystis sp.]